MCEKKTIDKLFMDNCFLFKVYLFFLQVFSTRSYTDPEKMEDKLRRSYHALRSLLGLHR